jgi:hypothetical protein
MPKIRFTPMRWFALLTLIVCILSLALPPDPETLKTYDISETAFKAVIVLLLIPEAILWYAGFYAFAKLLEYSNHLKGSKEYIAYRKITIGIGVLAFGLIIPSIIAQILNYIAVHNHGFKPSSMIINHYISLLVPLISFTYIRDGSQKLVGSGTHTKRGSLAGARIFAVFFILLAVFYSYITLRTRYDSDNPYYMSNLPLMLTIIVPYLYAWFEGLVSAYNFKLYSNHVKGLIYKKAFLYLSYGLGVTILGLIFVQFITSSIGARTDEPLGFVLVLIYILLAVLIAGLGLMARGTRKLQKIEEV